MLDQQQLSPKTLFLESLLEVAHPFLFFNFNFIFFFNSYMFLINMIWMWKSDFFFLLGGIFGIYPDENYYQTSSDTIKCKDGSNKFTKAQLNDDFCDCPDGTDEPGPVLLLICFFFCLTFTHFQQLKITRFYFKCLDCFGFYIKKLQLFMISTLSNECSIIKAYLFTCVGFMSCWIVGTSACPGGEFYCRNAGHTPVFLFSSRVNDGICGKYVSTTLYNELLNL